MKSEITLLQRELEKRNIDYYIVTTSDEHSSEYVSDHYKVREWLSGFSGSNGDLLIGRNEALLWTDGRYFVQADIELKDSGIRLMKMGEKDVPTLSDYIRDNITSDSVLAFDGATFTYSYIRNIYDKIKDKNVSLAYDEDIAGSLWENRPNKVFNDIIIYDIKYSGESVTDKLERVREQIKNSNCGYMFLNKLDDIMWLFNLRGSDVSCNPVAFSYAYVTESEAVLFVNKEALSEDVLDYLNDNNISVKDYCCQEEYLTECDIHGNILLDDKSVSFLIYKIFEDMPECNIVNSGSIVSVLKAVKNEKEIENAKEWFIKDSVAFTKYIYWLKKVANEGCLLPDGRRLNEVISAEKCDELRAGIEGFADLSFPTICAYGPNAAMMHYEADESNYSEIFNRGMLLTDCGGQFPGATTDGTRTVSMGDVTSNERKHYTLALKGMLNLMNASFIEGVTGRNLDILARLPLWNEGIDYKCGTGHGVGMFLNVHEGPQNIRWRYISGADEAVLKAGMFVTDEPGVYIEGEYGIRIENTLLIKSKCENSDGHFLCFEPLTFVPLDAELIDKQYLNDEDIVQLNNYNKEVYNKICVFLDEDEKKWLKEVTKPVSRED